MTTAVIGMRTRLDEEEFTRQQRPRLEAENAPNAVGDILVIAVDDIVFESSQPFNTTGHFSDLFLGRYRGKSKVAMKRPRIAGNRDSLESVQKFEQEALVWRLLRHPHILEFIGIYKAEGHMYLVSPFMENGTLGQYISAHPNADRPRFLSETADALAYLHTMKIVHGDVKSSNILVSADLRALICDLGLAKWMPTITASQSKGAGTVRWQSPELWQDAAPRLLKYLLAGSMKVLSGTTPFPDISTDMAVVWAVMQGVRPKQIPTHSSTGESYQRIWCIAANCWQREPHSRLTMTQVFELLTKPSQSVEEPGEGTHLSIPGPTIIRETIPPSLRSTPEAMAPEPELVGAEDSEWITFTPALAGRQLGKFQPAKATNQAYGAFSDVKMCEVIYENGRRETAALKRLRPIRIGSQAEDTNDIDKKASLITFRLCTLSLITTSLLQRFEREILVWAGIWHPNVAPLLGFTLSPAFYLISPWYPNGTIRQYISTNPSCDRLYLIQDVAAGLAYLHTCQPPIVHGDIKSNNVVVDADGHAKIIDFGLSQILEHSTTEANTVIEVGNSRWMAPEVLASQQITCMSDTASGLPPFRELQQGLQLVARPSSLKPVTDRTKYIRIPEEDPLWTLLFSCWEPEPVQRPSMTDLQAQIRSLISQRILSGNSSGSTPSPASTRSSADTNGVDAPSSLLLSIRATRQSNSEWSTFFQRSGLPAGRYRRMGSQVLGCGVLSDTWLCEMERDGEVQQVAAKELRFARESTDIFSRALEGLERDTRTWMAFKHPNIVPVLGYTFEESFLLLRHWCPNGNIRDYLKRKPECNKLRL
ncbi:hypothetical protein FRB90_001998, partial [Tulasnella sp. 427]